MALKPNFKESRVSYCTDRELWLLCQGYILCSVLEAVNIVMEQILTPGQKGLERKAVGGRKGEAQSNVHSYSSRAIYIH